MRVNYMRGLLMHSVCWKVGGAFKVSLELSHAHFFCVFVTAWPNAVLINMVPPWLWCTSTVFEELWGGTFVPLYCAHLSSSAKKSCQTLILLSALYCVRMCLHMQNVWFNMMEGLQTKCLDLHVFLSPSLFFFLLTSWLFMETECNMCALSKA